MCFVVQEKKKANTNDSRNMFFWFVLVEKWPFRDSYLFPKKYCLLSPYFYSLWGVHAFGPSCQKREFLAPPPKKKEKMLNDNWKAHFLVFFVLLAFSFFLIVFLFFLEGLGSGEVAQRATSLGPKPSLFVLVCLFFLLFFFLEGLSVRWGGPKGHLNPPHLLSLFVFFCCFCFQNTKTVFLPLKKAFLFSFQCLPLFLLSFMFFSPFSLSLSPSLSLSLSLSSCFLSFFSACFVSLFLLYFCFVFALFCFLAFVSFFCALFLCFCSWKEQHQNIKLERLFSSILSVLLFPVLLCFSNLFSLSLLFPDFEVCFLFNIHVFYFNDK